MIAIIDYGLGNLKSVKYALDRLGKDSILTERGEDLRAASGVILPGVGAFEQAMANLRDKGLVEPIRAVAASGRPLRGICLGVQLLLSQSQEYGPHPGLNIIPGQVLRFGQDLTVPHMGWNQVEQARPCPLFDGVADGAATAGGLDAERVGRADHGQRGDRAGGNLLAARRLVGRPGGR